MIQNDRGSQKSRNRKKIAAIAAGLLAVGIGATYTLASWTDSEWVWGGAAGNPGVGTSTFNVQQDTTVAFADTGWTDQSTNAGGSLVFTAGALSLTPGDSIYAPVALRASTTSVAGTVSLKAAVAASGVTVNDTGGALWSAIQVEVKTQRTTGGLAPTSACAAGAAGFDNASWGAVAGVSSLASAASATQVLDAAAGSVQHYCFKLTLPAGSPSTLQGRTIAPAWEFSGVSN